MGEEDEDGDGKENKDEDGKEKENEDGKKEKLSTSGAVEIDDDEKEASDDGDDEEETADDEGDEEETAEDEGGENEETGNEGESGDKLDSDIKDEEQGAKQATLMIKKLKEINNFLEGVVSYWDKVAEGDK